MALATQENFAQVWRFGIFEVDARNLELRRNGVPVRIREQPFRVLVYLLEHQGELVSREDLRRVLWPADTFVDFDHSLNTAMMKLRDALGDNVDAPVYIETVPKRGYRFVAPVSRPGGGPVEAIPQAAKTDPVAAGEGFAPSGIEAIPPAKSRTRVMRVAMASTCVLVIAVAGILMVRTMRRTGALQLNQSSESASFQVVPVTTAAGDANTPVFSPDGREIAYVWDGPERRHYDLYVQLLGAALPLRLTYSKGGDIGAPAWSPDGQQIAFERCDGKNDGVFVVPALGGDERQLTTAECLFTLPSPVYWATNSDDLFMVDRCSPKERFGVVNFSLATGAKRCLADAGLSQNCAQALGFALSPDGATIVFGRTTSSQGCSVYSIGSSGGAARFITSDLQIGCDVYAVGSSSGLMWTPDGRSIIFPWCKDGLPALFRVSASGGPAQRETIFPALGSFTKDGLRFAYSEQSSADPPAIWRADLDAAGGRMLEVKKVIGSQYPEVDAQPSPDGSHLVWMSMRAGNAEIWTSDASGRDPVQLTYMQMYSGTPRWSPDGKWIAFDSYLPHGPQIFVVDAEGRNLRAITSDPSDNCVPSWSRDGKSIYFASNRTGAWQVWKHSLENGAEMQLTKQGGFGPLESYDGSTVYYSRFYEAGIWKVPSRGGDESQVVEGKPQVGFWGHFAVTKAGLYFLDADAEPSPAIEFSDFATGRVSTVFSFKEHPTRLQPSLSATVDGKTIYFTQYDRQSVIKMMDFAH
jgi:Tol biopolymer transport system component/DNA-binding winged helix-turn-helix (wHTH) protein